MAKGLWTPSKLTDTVGAAVKFAVNFLKYSIKMAMEVGMALLKGDFVSVLKAIFTHFSGGG